MEGTFLRLRELFPQVDVRILKATAFEHPNNVNEAASYILSEVLPPEVVVDSAAGRSSREMHEGGVVSGEPHSGGVMSIGLPCIPQVMPAIGIAAPPMAVSEGSPCNPRVTGGSSRVHAPVSPVVGLSGEAASQTEVQVMQVAVGTGREAGVAVAVETVMQGLPVVVAATTNTEAPPEAVAVGTLTEALPERIAVGTTTEGGPEVRVVATSTDVGVGQADTVQQTEARESFTIGTGTEGVPVAAVGTCTEAVRRERAQQTEVVVGVQQGTEASELGARSEVTSALDGDEETEQERFADCDDVPAGEAMEEVMRGSSSLQLAGASGLEVLQALVQASLAEKEELSRDILQYHELCSEAEAAEAAAGRRKEAVACAGLDQREEAERLLQMLPMSRDNVEDRAGNIHGESVLLAGEARELQQRLKAVASMRAAVREELDELCAQLRARIEIARQAEAAAAKEEDAAQAEAQKLLDEVKAEMAEVELESKQLDKDEEKCTQLRDFLKEQGRAVDAMQGEVAVLREDLEGLRKHVHGVPFRLLRSGTNSSFVTTTLSPGLDSEPGIAIWRGGSGPSLPSLNRSWQSRIATSASNSLHSSQGTSVVAATVPTVEMVATTEAMLSSPVSRRQSTEISQSVRSSQSGGVVLPETLSASYTSAAYASAMAASSGDQSQMVGSLPSADIARVQVAARDPYEEPLSPFADLQRRISSIDNSAEQQEFELQRMMASQHVAFRETSRRPSLQVAPQQPSEEDGWHFLDMRRARSGSSRGSSGSSTGSRG